MILVCLSLAIFVVVKSLREGTGRPYLVADQSLASSAWEDRWLSAAAIVEDAKKSSGRILGMGMSSGMGAETDADARVDVNNGSRQGGASRQFESLSGTWAGIFSHSDMFDPNTKVKEWQFTAQLSHEDNSFSGYISDTLGEARVKGVVEYPLVRFSKSYQASNSSMWSVGKNLGTVYYEGRVNEDGETMTGKWFRYPLELNSYGGSWWMVLEGRDAHGKVLVPRKAEADA